MPHVDKIEEIISRVAMDHGPRSGLRTAAAAFTGSTEDIASPPYCMNELAIDWIVDF